MELTLIRMMEGHDPERLALFTDQGVAYTYSRLLNSVHTMSSVQKPRCLVFCLCSNTAGSLIGYLSCLAAGAVPLLLDRKMDDALLRLLFDRYKPWAVWMPEELSAAFPDLEVGAKQEDYVLLKTGNPVYPVNEALSLLLTTSGSTGSPKLVRQSMKNMVANARSIAEYLELDAVERPITTLPMHYTYGLSVIHSHLLVGGTVLLTDRSVMEEGFWTFFESAGATSLAGVPTTYQILNRVGFFERVHPTLRSFTQAGGKLPLAMHEKCARYAQEHGLRFYAMYGQTEATARMAYLPWQKSLEKCGSIGIPIPGGTFSLIDEQGREISRPGISGELIYRGENVTLGYAEGPEDLAKGDERHGVLHTGDLASRDEDGYYTITGRMKRFLKMSGSRVNLDECEQLIRQAFPEADCACSGVDDRLSVFVTLNTAQLDQVRWFLAEKLRLPLTSVRVEHLEEIPRNSAGKILYPKLEAKP